MNKKLAITISCVLLAAAFVLMFAVCALFPRTTESDHSTLKEFPELTLESVLSGKFFSEFTAWFTDTVFGRDRCVDINASFRGYFGIMPEEQVFINDGAATGSNGDLIMGDEFEDDWVPEDDEDEEYEDETTPVTTVPSTTPPSTSSGETTVTPPETTVPVTTPPETTMVEITQAPVGEEISDGILIMGTRAMEIYYGSKKNAVDYATILNSFAQKVGSGVKVYSMVIPKSCGFYLADSKTSYAKYASRTTRDLTAHKEALSGVTYIPVYEALLPHKDEEIYFRTDHHWTGLGAYYAAEEFARIAGVDFMPLSSYTKNVRPGYVGTMYKYTNHSPTLLNNPEDFVTYVPGTPYTVTKYNTKLKSGKARDSIFYSVPDNKRSSWYSTYLGNDSYSFIIKSGTCQNGRKLLIVKDSYGNALSPYFMNSFEEIYIVDGRYFEIGLVSLVQSKGITDVLFAECTFSAVGAYRNNVKALIS